MMMMTFFGHSQNDGKEEDFYSTTSLEWLRNKYCEQIERFDYSDYSDEVFLDTIVIKDEYRGHGYGTMFMNDLCDYADKHKKRIALIPSNLLGTSIFILEKFYKRFGFVYGKASYENHFMIREYKYNGKHKQKINKRRA